MTRTALILGANGRFGRHSAAAFSKSGWRVSRFDRDHDSLWEACWGVDVIVNGWNPPYPRWQADLPGQTRRLIEVAEASGALTILPGNVYPFGRDAPSRLSAEVPHLARNPLGRARAEMEAAWKNSTARVLILRGGDFLDTEPSGNWFDKILVRDLARGRFTYPGPPDVPHAWAWLPDLARAAVALAEHADDHDRFRDIPFPGYSLTGEQLRQALERVVGRTLRSDRMSWLPLRMAAPVWPMGRHLLEMRYLWRKPHFLDDKAFHAALPGFDSTPLEEALASAIHHQVNPDEAVTRGVARHGERLAG